MLSAEPTAEADNTYRYLDYSGYQKTDLKNCLFYIVLKKITTNTGARNLNWHCKKTVANVFVIFVYLSVDSKFVRQTAPELT